MGTVLGCKSIPIPHLTMTRKQTLGPGILALITATVCGCASTNTGSGTTTQPNFPTVKFANQADISVSLHDLSAGVEIPIDVVIPPAASALRAAPLDGAGCQTADKNGLILFPVVHHGPDVVYCPACDVGYCVQPPSENAGALRAGSYRYSFHWRGEQGFGPSHYARALGATIDSPSIEPGDYRLTVTTAFVSASSSEALAGKRRSEASLLIHVVK